MDELSPITSSCSSSDSSVQSASFDGQIVLLRAASILAQVTPPPPHRPDFRGRALRPSHLRLHAGASGLRETDLSKGHERTAAKLHSLAFRASF